MDEAEIRDKYPHVRSCWLPTPYQYRSFSSCIDWTLGCDDVGNFLGWCPLHDRKKKHHASAEFNFHKGIMRCQGDPSCSAPKRAMSMSNVLARIANVS